MGLENEKIYRRSNQVMQKNTAIKKSISSILYALWLLVVVFAFIGGNVMTYPLGNFHIFPFRILLLLYLFIFLVVIFLNRGRINLPVNNKEIKFCLIFLLIWLIYGAISFIWAASKIDCIRHIFFLFAGISIIFFTLYNFNNEQRIKQLYLFWVLTIVCLIGIGIWEIFTGHHLPAYDRNSLLKESSGVFTNPNDYATFLSLTIPFSYGLLRYNKNIFYKILGALLIIIAIYFIIFNKSRANMIAIILEGIALIFLSIKKNRFRFFMRISVLLLVFLLVFISLPQFAKNFLSLQYKKLPSELQYKKISKEFSSLTSNAKDIRTRKNLLKNGLVFLKSTAFMGVGAGNNEWHQENRNIYDTYGKTNMHNWWMELLVNYGILIFILYLLFYIFLIMSLFKATKSHIRIIKIMSECLFIALIGFSIASISSSSIMTNKAIWFLFATAIVIINIHKSTKDKKSKILKILVISHMYPSAFNEVSGIFIHQQVKELLKQGCEVKVISPIPWIPFPLKYFKSKWKRYAEVPQRAKCEGIDVYYPRYLEFPKTLFFASSGRRMFADTQETVEEIYNHFKFDIIHSHVVLPDGYSGMLLAKNYKKPLIVTIHGQDFLHTIFKDEKCKKNIEKVMNFSEKTITVSNKLKKAGVNELKIDPNKVTIISNGINPNDIFIGKSEVLQKYKGRKVLLSVSHLIDTKGIDLNIKAIARLKKRYPDLIYLIIGVGVERKSLEELVKDLGLQDNVEFIGELPHHKVMEYMSICDIFSLPSWNEGFGVVYLEAMIHGKPAIACKGEGIEGIIKDKETGILVKPKDVDSLCEAIDYLLLNPEKAKEIGREAKKLVLENYILEKSVQKIIRMYKELLES